MLRPIVHGTDWHHALDARPSRFLTSIRPSFYRLHHHLDGIGASQEISQNKPLNFQDALCIGCYQLVGLHPHPSLFTFITDLVIPKFFNFVRHYFCVGIAISSAITSLADNI